MAQAANTVEIEEREDGGARVTILRGQAQMLGEIQAAGAENLNLVAVFNQVDDARYPSYFDPDKKLTGPEMLAEMGRVCVDEYKKDNASRQKWLEETAKDMELFTSFMARKSTPFEGASNVNVPMMSIAALQFHARAYENLVSPKETVKVKGVALDDKPTAKNVAKMLNYQFMDEMEEFDEGMDKSLLQLPIEGSIFRKTYWDYYMDRPVSEYCSGADIVVNYGCRRFEDAVRVTQELYMSRSDVNKRYLSGIYAFSAKMLGKLPPPTPTNVVKEAIDKIEGREKTQEYQSEYHLIEQHRGWCTTDDGVDHHYVITVDVESGKVLRITDREYDDEDGKPQVIQYFTHYQFIPNPEGVYGLGFGALIRRLNHAANTILNEVIDAGSLANLQGGFISKRGRISKGDLSFTMGEWKEVDAYSDDINKSIWSFNFKGPNGTLYQVLDLLFGYAKQLSTVTEGMAGEMPSSDTPNAATMAILEEGRKVFSAINKRNHRAFRKEIDKVARLDSLFLTEKKYHRILGVNENNTAPEVLETINRKNFASRKDIVPFSDPMIMSRAEKFSKAQMASQYAYASPLISKNPAALYIVDKMYMEALGIDEVDQIVQPPAGPKDEPAELENSKIIAGEAVSVLPNQDHAYHIQVLDSLQASPFWDQMGKDSQKAWEAHRKQHLSMLYTQQQQATQATGAPAPAVQGAM